ncbi:hypothetical protein, partial [Anaerovibrio lipolyticus]|uniref:hypothetical protein n=1 Tax=Anaerovibrio lipolyticus TaxID=82374 RepID=UPI001F16B64D
NALVQNYLHASIIAAINLYLLFSRKLKLSVIIVIGLFLQRIFLCPFWAQLKCRLIFGAAFFHKNAAINMYDRLRLRIVSV